MTEANGGEEETAPVEDLAADGESAPEAGNGSGARQPNSAPLALADLPGLAGVPIDNSRRDAVIHPPRGRFHEVVTTLKDAGFAMCVDLCGVDYLEHPDRSVPDGVTRERFEVVVGLLSLEEQRRVRLRVQVPAGDPTLPTLFDLYPGTENMERETFDMFGIIFTDHPDMTRILMPEEWEGHPLRKDYSVGRVPVHFKEAPGPR
jgi:NADH-quinone oxidoreductase subunit C